MRGLTDLEARLLGSRGLVEVDTNGEEHDAIWSLAAFGRLNLTRLGDDDWVAAKTTAGRAALRIHNAIRAAEGT